MSDVSEKGWLLAQLERLPKAQMVEFMDQLPSRMRPSKSDPVKTCDAMRAYLRLARSWYWSEKQMLRDSLQPRSMSDNKARHAPVKSLCEIPASVANEMLRSEPDDQEGQSDG